MGIEIVAVGGVFRPSPKAWRIVASCCAVTIGAASRVSALFLVDAQVDTVASLTFDVQHLI